MFPIFLHFDHVLSSLEVTDTRETVSISLSVSLPSLLLCCVPPPATIFFHNFAQVHGFFVPLSYGKGGRHEGGHRGWRSGRDRSNPPASLEISVAELHRCPLDINGANCPTVPIQAEHAASPSAVLCTHADAHEAILVNQKLSLTRSDI